jgi:hypothetical protein
MFPHDILFHLFFNVILVLILLISIFFILFYFLFRSSPHYFISLVFISGLILIILINVFGLESFIKLIIFSIASLYTCFYIRFDPHSFNYDIFGVESFIELICLWISSFDILFLYQI